jgi:hypothetical protein
MLRVGVTHRLYFSRPRHHRVSAEWQCSLVSVVCSEDLAAAVSMHWLGLGPARCFLLAPFTSSPDCQHGEQPCACTQVQHMHTAAACATAAAASASCVTTAGLLLVPESGDGTPGGHEHKSRLVVTSFVCAHTRLICRTHCGHAGVWL